MAGGESGTEELKLPKARSSAAQVRAPLRVLSLTGGGYRGLFTAKVLVALCKRAKTMGPLSSTIEVFAGTSIGGLMACALAAGIVPTRVLDVIDHHGPKVFPATRLASSRRKFFGALYDSGHIDEAIDDCLGSMADTKLSELERGLLVPAVDWVGGRVQLYMSGYFGKAHASKATLRQVCLATSAAPTYFKPAEVDGMPMLDGGLAANNPDSLALLELARLKPDRMPFLEMLSIGTAGADDGRSVKTANRSGLGWAPDIAVFMIDLQERLAASQAARMLGNRYLRVNHPGSASKVFHEMDVADRQAREQLLMAGEEAASAAYRASSAFIDRFLNAGRSVPVR
jgi:uncharacterized protein